MSYQKELTFLKGFAMGAGHNSLTKAILLAKKEHEGQTRAAPKGATKPPYISHPVRVASYLLALGVKDERTLTGAILHDIVEDTRITEDDLTVQNYSLGIIGDVRRLSKESGLNEEELNMYFEDILISESAVLIKLSDRVHNISTMRYAFSDEKIRKYIDETNNHILPMARKAKDRYPEVSNIIIAMMYQIESVIEAMEMYLESRIASLSESVVKH